MSIHVKVIWEWLKKNWKLSLLIIWSILVWLFSRRSSQAAIAAMNANKESYEARIRALKEQRKIEIQKREELTLKYEETLAKIEKKHKKRLRDLSKEEKSRIKEIVKEAKGNPAEIDEKIENLFGFAPHD